MSSTLFRIALITLNFQGNYAKFRFFATRLTIFEAWGQELELIYFSPPASKTGKNFASDRRKRRAHLFPRADSFRDEYASSDDEEDDNTLLFNTVGISGGSVVLLQSQTPS